HVGLTSRVASCRESLVPLRWSCPRCRGCCLELPICVPPLPVFLLPIHGADGETRTPTAFATAPSRQRVYQFHHVGVAEHHFGTSPFLSAPPAGAGLAAAAGCGTEPAAAGADDDPG